MARQDIDELEFNNEQLAAENEEQARVIKYLTSELAKYACYDEDCICAACRAKRSAESETG